MQVTRAVETLQSAYEIKIIINRSQSVEWEAIGYMFQPPIMRVPNPISRRPVPRIRHGTFIGVALWISGWMTLVKIINPVLICVSFLGHEYLNDAQSDPNIVLHFSCGCTFFHCACTATNHGSCFYDETGNERPCLTSGIVFSLIYYITHIYLRRFEWLNVGVCRWIMPIITNLYDKLANFFQA